MNYRSHEGVESNEKTLTVGAGYSLMAVSLSWFNVVQPSMTLDQR